MADSANESHNHQNHNIARFMQSASSNLFSLLTTLNPNNFKSSSNPKITSQLPNHQLSISTTFTSSSSICVPLLFSDAPSPSSNFALASAPSSSSSTSSSFQQPDENNSLSSSSSTSTIKKMTSGSASGFPSTVRISGLNSNQKGGGPAFVGQVFSMCDISGTGLMAVSTHIEIPFLSKRTPEWIKKMFAAVTKNDRDGPMFRFFMDLGDAVSYVKQLNIPTGVVGACRLDLAYEHFKEKPHMFQFIPNEKQVKAANKLLKTIPQNSGIRSIDGVPVFTAENLDIAIATSDGIKWYTPYFFDKKMLDNILEESVDQHFHSLIQSRRMQRRRDVIDDNLAADVVEENGDSIWEPPEVQEVMDEMGHPTIPLSVISKVAEMQLHYAVDKVMLGNRWLRKATGIQPKFPYMVDSFERRTAASFLKAAESTSAAPNLETDCENHTHETEPGSTDLKLKESAQGEQGQRSNYRDFRFPFGEWFSNPWSRQQEKTETQVTSDTRINSSVKEHIKGEAPQNPLLPRITMVGISTGETGQLSRSNLKKTMEDLTRKLEQTGQSSDNNNSNIELRDEDRDPLFVANVGDYSSGLAKTGSSRWVRGGNN